MIREGKVLLNLTTDEKWNKVIKSLKGKGEITPVDKDELVGEMGELLVTYARMYFEMEDVTQALRFTDYYQAFRIAMDVRTKEDEEMRMWGLRLAASTRESLFEIEDNIDGSGKDEYVLAWEAANVLYGTRWNRSDKILFDNTKTTKQSMAATTRIIRKRIEAEPTTPEPMELDGLLHDGFYTVKLPKCTSREVDIQESKSVEAFKEVMELL